MRITSFVFSGLSANSNWWWIYFFRSAFGSCAALLSTWKKHFSHPLLVQFGPKDWRPECCHRKGELCLVKACSGRTVQRRSSLFLCHKPTQLCSPFSEFSEKHTHTVFFFLPECCRSVSCVELHTSHGVSSSWLYCFHSKGPPSCSSSLTVWAALSSARWRCRGWSAPAPLAPSR